MSVGLLSGTARDPLKRSMMERNGGVEFGSSPPLRRGAAVESMLHPLECTTQLRHHI
jgi:hypothetical protein